MPWYITANVMSTCVIIASVFVHRALDKKLSDQSTDSAPGGKWSGHFTMAYAIVTPSLVLYPPLVYAYHDTMVTTPYHNK